MPVINNDDIRIVECNEVEEQIKTIYNQLVADKIVTAEILAKIQTLMTLSEEAGVLNYRIELDL